MVAALFTLTLIERRSARSTYLHRPHNMGERCGSAPTADKHETVRSVAEGQSSDQDPDVDVAPGADAADEPVEVGNIVEISSDFLFHGALSEAIDQIGQDIHGEKPVRVLQPGRMKMTGERRPP